MRRRTDCLPIGWAAYGDIRKCGCHADQKQREGGECLHEFDPLALFVSRSVDVCVRLCPLRFVSGESGSSLCQWAGLSGRTPFAWRELYNLICVLRRRAEACTEVRLLLRDICGGFVLRFQSSVERSAQHPHLSPELKALRQENIQMICRPDHKHSRLGEGSSFYNYAKKILATGNLLTTWSNLCTVLPSNCPFRGTLLRAIFSSIRNPKYPIYQWSPLPRYFVRRSFIFNQLERCSCTEIVCFQ